MSGYFFPRTGVLIYLKTKGMAKKRRKKENGDNEKRDHRCSYMHQFSHIPAARVHGLGSGMCKRCCLRR